MALAVPTTQEVADDIIAQLEANISQTIPLLPKAFTRVLAKALAGVFTLVIKYAGWTFLQLFVAYASFQETEVLGRRIRPLVELGRLIGVGDPAEAGRAEMLIDVTVTNQEGSLDAGSQLLRSETGVLYQTLEPVDLDAPVVQVTVRASADQDGNGGAGEIGNLTAGDVISFANPLSNVSPNATVSSVTSAGTNAETADEYRARVFSRFRNKPQGGAYADYHQWSLSVDGIINAYPYTGAPGEVDIYIEATESSSGDPDGIPTQAQLDTVLDAINLDDAGLASRRPVNAAPNVYPISRHEFDVLITGLDVEDLDGTKDLIEEGLDEYLRSREPYIEGLSVLPREDRITVAALGGIVDTIVSAQGGAVTRVEMETSGVDITAWTLTTGQKAKLGAVQYISA